MTRLLDTTYTASQTTYDLYRLRPPVSLPDRAHRCLRPAFADIRFVVFCVKPGNRLLRPFTAANRVPMLRITYAYHGHHRGYCFDWAALSAELTRGGFVDVRRHAVREGDDLAFRDLEQRDEPTEAATQLVVHARRML